MLKKPTQTASYSLETIDSFTLKISFSKGCITEDILTTIYQDNALLEVKHLLISTPYFLTIDQAAQQYAKNIAKELTVTHIAVLTAHFLQNLGVQVYSKLFTPSFTIKVFKEEDTALTWFAAEEI